MHARCDDNSRSIMMMTRRSDTVLRKLREKECGYEEIEEGITHELLDS